MIDPDMPYWSVVWGFHGVCISFRPLLLSLGVVTIGYGSYRAREVHVARWEARSRERLRQWTRERRQRYRAAQIARGPYRRSV